MQQREKIIEGMRYCYELKHASCSECPIRDVCSKTDADSLGEMFSELLSSEHNHKAGIDAPEGRENYNDL